MLLVDVVVPLLPDVLPLLLLVSDSPLVDVDPRLSFEPESSVVDIAANVVTEDVRADVDCVVRSVDVGV